MVALAFNANTQDIEARSQVQGQPGLHNESLSLKIKIFFT